MKTLLTSSLIVTCFLFNGYSNAQCPTGGIVLNSQEDVNNFPDGCTMTNGALTIKGPDITDLSPLKNITSIGGFLKINRNDALTNLDGLDNLTSVGAYVEIGNNGELTSLEGLHSLEKVETILNIIKNDKLTTLSGLDNITSIGKYLLIYENNQLTSLEGLGGLKSIEKGLRIQKNTELTTLEGLNNLSTVGGNINILSNHQLSDLNGLEHLTSAGGFLKITGNPVLTSLRGLTNLVSIDGYIKIRNNHTLTSLSGLENIDPESITDLRLTANEVLSFCNLPNICEYLSNGGKSNIKFNAGTCATKRAVQSTCESLVDITSVESLDDINVECNTPLEDLGLPSTVGVTFSDNKTDTMSVKWVESDYNGTVGTHTLTGNLELMGPTANPNSLTAQITVVVEDTQAPVPDIADLPTLTGKCSVIISQPPTATDSCGGNVTATTDDPLQYDKKGNYTITWTYDDGNGNSIAQDQTVIVEITSSIPVIECPETHIVSCDPVVTFDLPVANNNCGSANIVQTDGTGFTSGSEFPLGTTTLTFQTSNVAGSASCSIKIEVLPELKIEHVSGVQNGDTLHLPDCIPPDISKDDLDLGPHRKGNSLRSNIYSADLPEPRPYGMWKLLKYAYEVTDRCGVTESFGNYMALYDLVPPVFLNFPADMTIATATDLPDPDPGIEILDICRSVVWDTVTTTAVTDPQMGDTLAFVRRWMAEDVTGHRSYRDQMIHIAKKMEYGQVTARIAQSEDITSARFPGAKGTSGIPVTLYRVETAGMNAVDSMRSGDYQGKEGTVFFTPLSMGAYRIHVDVPEGYVAVHPDTVVNRLGWSDVLDITRDTMVDLGRIVLVRDSSDVDTTEVTEALVGGNTPLTGSVRRKRPTVKVYPNPTSDRVKVKVSEPGTKTSIGGSYIYGLYDRLGRTVRTGVLTDGTELDLGGQPGGLYYLRIHSEGQRAGIVKVMVMGE